MATKTEDPSASTTTPIVEGSSFDDQTEAPTEPVPQMPPPITDYSMVTFYGMFLKPICAIQIVLV